MHRFYTKYTILISLFLVCAVSVSGGLFDPTPPPPTVFDLSVLELGGGDKWIDNGTYLTLNETFANNIFILGYIYAYDWSNVSITSSQISDFSVVFDTDLLDIVNISMLGIGLETLGNVSPSDLNATAEAHNISLKGYVDSLDHTTIDSDELYIVNISMLDNDTVIRTGNETWAIKTVNNSINDYYNHSIELDPYYDAVGDIPTATPSDGDTTHLSTADQIYDYIVSLNYITNAVADLVNYYTTTKVDENINNNITDVRADAMKYTNLTHLGSSDINTSGNVNISGQVYIGGNVGIGTASPDQKLYVVAGDGLQLLLEVDSSGIGDYTGIKFKVSTNDDNLVKKGGIFFERTGTNGRGKMHIALDDIDDSTNVILTDSKMVVDYTGNVGIGTVSPDAELEVEGVIRVTDPGSTRYFIEAFSSGGVGYIDSYDSTGNDYEDLVVRADDFIFEGEGNERFRIEDSGNVGIGTATPTTKLNVIGSGNFTGNLTGNQIYGEMWNHSHGNEFDVGIDISGEYENITNLNNSIGTAFTRPDGHSLGLQIDGSYFCGYSVGFTGALPNHRYSSTLFVNEIDQDNIHDHDKTSTATDELQLNNRGYVSNLKNGDYITLRITDEEGTATATIYHSNVWCERKGD